MKWIIHLLLIAFTLPVTAQEICSNGKDDDFDGTIDLQDAECSCNGSFIRTREMSIIPNHSFESSKCCPVAFSQMKCVNDWIQPSEGTSDYLHACGNYDIDTGNVEPRHPPVPLPLPDGEGAVGIINGIIDHMFYKGVYKEYVATRLWRPLQGGVNYQLDMEVGFGFDAAKLPPLEVIIWGHPKLSGLPFNLGIPNCPALYDDQWIVLGRSTIGGSNEWVKTAIDLNIPYDINCIAIGPDCNRPTDSLLYYYFDNLVLYKNENARSFYVDIAASPKCNKTETLRSNVENDGYAFQWFKDGVAIQRANSDSLLMKNIPEENGQYQLMVSKSGLCQVSEPFIYTAKEKLNNFADLGPDIIACPGDTVTLTNPVNEVESYWGYYKWSTGDQGGRLKVTETGDYWLEIRLGDIATNETVCHTWDTVHVSFESNAVVDLGPDQYICDNEPVTITSNINGASHKWNTGDVTASIQVTKSGTYTDTVTLGGCQVSGSVDIVPNPLQIELGADVLSCEGRDVTFSPQLPAGTTYLWNGTANDDHFSTQQTGPVTLQAELAGCFRSDTVNVIFNPSPAVHLGNDTVLCEGQSLILDATTAPNDQYLWNNGTNNATMRPVQSGTYSVKVTGTNSCYKEDTIIVEFTDLPTIEMDESTILCRGSTLSYQPVTKFAKDFLWSDGLQSAHREFTAPGMYQLQVSNFCGTAKRSILVKDGGICAVIFPNVFTPNSDGKNDVFRSNITSGLSSYTLTIYNRWGQVIFRSPDPSAGWDGRINGQHAQTGSYIWTLTYQTLADNRIRQEKGWVMLAR